MEDTKNVSAPSEPEITIDGFGPEEAKKLKEILTRFLHEYGKKPPEVSDEDWLCQRFQAELPGMSEEDAKAVSRETVASVKEYDANLASLSAAKAQGQTTEEWFADRSREAATGISAIEFGHRMEELGDVISEANAQLYRTVTTQGGKISQQLNLDGFLAEQQAVNSFNAAAKLNDSPFRAEVCVPEAGQTYGKNSFDVVIRGEGGQIVHQYQFKYGKDANATIQMLKRGNYNNQTLVVPPEQVDAVKEAFPGKTVVSHIGGTEKVPVSSEPLSKADVKAMQAEVQSTGKLTETGWNSYDNRMLGKYIGKQAVAAGMQGAILATGFHLAAKLVSDEPVETEEVVADALRTGADMTVKAAAAGAMTVAAQKGALGVLSPLTSVMPIANLACVAVENVKTLGRAAAGDLTAGEALDQMGNNTAAMYYGLGCAPKGMAVGAAALGWIPIAGPVIGGIVGGLIGYTAGSKFGQAVYHAAKSVAKTAVKAVKKIGEGIKSIAGKIGRFLFG